MKRDAPKPNQAVVARTAGVSTATVSLALNNHPRISAATKRRVREVARRLGYTPDPQVRQLMAKIRQREPGRGETIGYVMCDEETSRPSLVRAALGYLVGLRRRAAELGHKIEVFRLGQQGMPESRLSRIIRHRGIRGLCIAPMPHEHERIDFDWKHFPAVAFGYGLVAPDLNRLAKHHYNNALLALQTLDRLGHRRIGFIGIPAKDVRWQHLNTAGVLTFQNDIPVERRVPMFVDAIELEVLVPWFERHRPDAIVGFGAQPRALLAQAGYNAPRDYSYADMDADQMPGKVAGIDQRSELVGVTALDQIIGLLLRNEFGVPENPHVVLINGRWSDGPSARRVRATRPSPTPVKAQSPRRRSAS